MDISPAAVEVHVTLLEKAYKKIMFCLMLVVVMQVVFSRYVLVKQLAKRLKHRLARQIVLS